MLTDFLQNFGLFILTLFCLGLTSQELVIHKENLGQIREKLKNFELFLESKNWLFLVNLVKEYRTCPICNSSLTVLFCGFWTGIFNLDITFITITLLVFTPIGLLIGLINKIL